MKRLFTVIGQRIGNFRIVSRLGAGAATTAGGTFKYPFRIVPPPGTRKRGD